MHDRSGFFCAADLGATEMKLLALLFALLVTLSACHGATYTAASCSYADVNDCINHGGANTCSPGGSHTAVAGDIIKIPANTCTWTSILTVTVNITIQGAGSPNTLPSQYGSGTLTTILIDNAGTGSAMITAENLPYSSGALFRISTLDIEPETASTALHNPIDIQGVCTSSRCPNARVDNIGFGLTTQWSESGNGNGAAWLIRTDGVFGVADHNTEPAGSGSEFITSNLSAYLGTGSYGDNSWAQPDSYGTANEFYIENNSIYAILAVADQEAAPTNGQVGGSRIAGRFNHITMSGADFTFGGHGLDTDGRPQGVRTIESYGNSVTFTGSQGGDAGASFRGGTGIIFGNAATTTAGGSFVYWFDNSVYRVAYVATSGWGACGGSSAYDNNDGGTISSSFAIGSITTNVITASGSPGWTTNQWAPGTVGSGKFYTLYDFTASSGNSQYAAIVSNTSNTITLASTPSGWNSGDTFYIVGSTNYGTGTATSGTSGLTLQDTTQSWTTNQFIPTGSPYSVYDTTQDFWSEATGNTSNTVTVQSANHGGFTAFAIGDSYVILRATVCNNQQGRGQGGYVSGIPVAPAGALNEALDPVYEWDDSGTPTKGQSSGDIRLISNRDWYSDYADGTPHVQTSPTSPFTGAATPGANTNGVGFGTLANRPTTCTAGVGYWATDQGSWNTSSNTYTGGYSQGELFTCVGTNTWSASAAYIPYTYPHPLIGGGGGSASNPVVLSGSITGNASIQAK
jgi:hypothetical protein